MRFRVLYPWLFTTAIIANVGCRPYTESDVNFAESNAATNVGIIFQGDRSGGIQAGTEADMKIMRELLPNFGFQVDEQQATTPQHVHDASGEAAKRVGADGTLFWFITTHGAPNGQLSIGEQGGYFTDFGNVAAAMRQARGDKAIRRLIVFVEACFSGQNIDGQTAITQNSGSGGILGGGTGRIDYGYGLAAAVKSPVDAIPKSLSLTAGSNLEQMANSILDRLIAINNPPPPVQAQSDSPTGAVGSNHVNPTGVLYEQAVLITSSAGSEYSYLTGDGSYAAKAFLSAYESMSGQRSTATINQFLEVMRSNVGTNSQNVQFKLDPPEIGNDLLFK